VKIAVFSDCYLPAINGVVTSITQQQQALMGLGHQVDLYCPHYPAKETPDPNVYRLWARPFWFHKREQMTFPWPPSVLRTMWSNDYDLFHIQTPFSVGLLGLFISLARRIPRVFHHHTLWEEYVDYLPIPKKVSSTGSVALCRGLANLSQAVVAPSAEVKERFSQQGVTTPIHVIPTGIQVDRFQGGTVKAERSEGEEVCLYIGRLAHEKSVDAVVRVFARIHQERPSTRLWLVGDGPARPALEEQVRQLGLSGACRFFGFVPRDTLRDFVASSRLFLFCSVTETQGLVLLEAQAGGLPAVAFASSGVNEAVDSGQTGFLVEQGREDLMAEAALKILTQEDLWSRFSSAAQAWSGNFSLKRMGEALEKAYEEARHDARNREK
jgi:glycosyltransferase involved in cell wall biosynthesis